MSRRTKRPVKRADRGSRLAQAFLAVLRSAGLRLGEAMGVRQQEAKRRRPGRQRERGGGPRARRTARRHLLRSHTATAQQYAAQALMPTGRRTKRRARGRKGTP